MPTEQLLRLVQGTADAAFAIDGSGLVSAWNMAAEELLGLSSAEALGRACHEILQCSDEQLFCSEHYLIRHAIQMNQPMANFDLQVQAKTEKQWCNVSVLIVTELGSGLRHAVLIVRPRELRKRMELLMRDFLVAQTQLEPEVATRLISSGRAMVKVNLTTRETEILRMVASCAGTNAIAKGLYISRATVNNHIKHILTKLNAHTRLEAVRRAEGMGLLWGAKSVF